MKSWHNTRGSGGTPESRTAEAWRILDEMGLRYASFDKAREQEFISSLVDNFEQYGSRTIITVKQLFWLRDLKERYL